MKKKTDNLNKFYNKKRNSAVKEEIKQEKKAEKRARREGIERHFEEKRKKRELGVGSLETEARSRKPTDTSQRSSDNKLQATNYKPELIPLNKYLSHSGVCSRRDAAELIRQGKVLVNNNIITEP